MVNYVKVTLNTFVIKLYSKCSLLVVNIVLNISKLSNAKVPNAERVPHFSTVSGYLPLRVASIYFGITYFWTAF